MNVPKQPVEPHPLSAGGTRKGKTLLKGHALRHEGAAYTADGQRFVDSYGRLGGPGHALCECGAVSPDLPSSSARRRWHADHKARASLR